MILEGPLCFHFLAKLHRTQVFLVTMLRQRIFFQSRILILTFIGPCVVIYFYSETKQTHQYVKFILFLNDTVHVSGFLSVHHQEFMTVHTATGICQTVNCCLLYLFGCCMYSLELLMMDGKTVRNM